MGAILVTTTPSGGCFINVDSYVLFHVKIHNRSIMPTQSVHPTFGLPDFDTTAQNMYWTKQQELRHMLDTLPLLLNYKSSRLLEEFLKKVYAKFY